MKIKLICIGKKMPDWIQTGIDYYQKQLPRTMSFELIALEAQKRKGKNIQQIKELEGDLLLQACKKSTLIIAFDECGKQHTTQIFAKNLEDWQQSGEHVAFLIGGADGLSEAVKTRAKTLWGLSNLTLPHAFARLLAVEQIYRAYSLINNHPYHRV
jgi:23S rRNA (pseudouridine1915-N3)-methyltransferase